MRGTFERMQKQGESMENLPVGSELILIYLVGGAIAIGLIVRLISIGIRRRH